MSSVKIKVKPSFSNLFKCSVWVDGKWAYNSLHMADVEAIQIKSLIRALEIEYTEIEVTE